MLVGALLLGIALFVALIFHARRNIRQVDERLAQVNEQLGKAHARLKRPIPVRLANRTLEIEATSPFPKAFAQHQTPSARGTLPFLVVCAEPVTRAAREQVAACGARVVGVIPDRTLLVEADEPSLAKLASSAAFAGACELAPADKIGVAGLTPADDALSITLVPLADEDVSAVSNAVITLGGQVLATPAGRVRARVPAARLPALAARGDVRWIERYAPAKLLNDVAVNPGLLNVRKAWAAPHGLTGAGQIITLADSGLDTGSTNTVMADFRGRVNLIRTVDGANDRDVNGHGTHVAGSLAGDGALSGGTIRGVAYGATLNVWQGTQGNYFYTPDSLDDLFRPDHVNYPSYIFSGSWGYSYGGTYTDLCSEYDDWIWRHPDALVVLAAGNDYRYKVLDPGNAKNTLCVGASESLRLGSSLSSYADNPAQVSSYSSRGPTADGRIKPDICAPGTMILSTRTTQVAYSKTVGWQSYAANSNYTYMGGTSMATPLVAGCAALVRQWLVERRGFAGTPPTSALMKAILMGGAHDLFGDTGTNVEAAAPDSRQGWGRVDLGETLYPSNRSVKLVDRIPFAAGSERVWRVETTRAAPLDVQLVWIDYPATAAGGGGLVNDLDLVVSNRTTGVAWWGNGVAGGDRTNNVEGVRIASAPAGTYEVRVRGVTVPYASAEGGAAALYMRGAFRWGMSVVFR